ncbi:MAG: hypothetical protein KC713_05535, partial [Candidatus Omnitrophica bacterium]|nr:hypothetical protein [Candidatus Omnitrophota bacterium]
ESVYPSAEDIRQWQSQPSSMRDHQFGGVTVKFQHSVDPTLYERFRLYTFSFVDSAGNFIIVTNERQIHRQEIYFEYQKTRWYARLTSAKSIRYDRGEMLHRISKIMANAELINYFATDDRGDVFGRTGLIFFHKKQLDRLETLAKANNEEAIQTLLKLSYEHARERREGHYELIRQIVQAFGSTDIGLSSKVVDVLRQYEPLFNQRVSRILTESAGFSEEAIAAIQESLTVEDFKRQMLHLMVKELVPVREIPTLEQIQRRSTNENVEAFKQLGIVAVAGILFLILLNVGLSLFTLPETVVVQPWTSSHTYAPEVRNRNQTADNQETASTPVRRVLNDRRGKDRARSIGRQLRNAEHYQSQNQVISARVIAGQEYIPHGTMIFTDIYNGVAPDLSLIVQNDVHIDTTVQVTQEEAIRLAVHLKGKKGDRIGLHSIRGRLIKNIRDADGNPLTGEKGILKLVDGLHVELRQDISQPLAVEYDLLKVINPSDYRLFLPKVVPGKHLLRENAALETHPNLRRFRDMIDSIPEADVLEELPDVLLRQLVRRHMIYNMYFNSLPDVGQGETYWSVFGDQILDDGLFEAECDRGVMYLALAMMRRNIPVGFVWGYSYDSSEDGLVTEDRGHAILYYHNKDGVLTAIDATEYMRKDPRSNGEIKLVESRKEALLREWKAGQWSLEMKMQIFEKWLYIYGNSSDAEAAQKIYELLTTLDPSQYQQTRAIQYIAGKQGEKQAFLKIALNDALFGEARAMALKELLDLGAVDEMKDIVRLREGYEDIQGIKRIIPNIYIDMSLSYAAFENFPASAEHVSFFAEITVDKQRTGAKRSLALRKLARALQSTNEGSSLSIPQDAHIKAVLNLFERAFIDGRYDEDFLTMYDGFEEGVKILAQLEALGNQQAARILEGSRQYYETVVNAYEKISPEFQKYLSLQKTEENASSMQIVDLEELNLDLGDLTWIDPHGSSGKKETVNPQEAEGLMQIIEEYERRVPKSFDPRSMAYESQKVIEAAYNRKIFEDTKMQTSKRKIPAKPVTNDQNLGGVNFNPDQMILETSGQAIQKKKKKLLNDIQSVPFTGIQAEIYEIVPVTNLPLLLSGESISRPLQSIS